MKLSSTVPGGSIGTEPGNEASDFLLTGIESEYNQDLYIQQLKRRFPFLSKRTDKKYQDNRYSPSRIEETKKSILTSLQWNKDRRGGYKRYDWPELRYEKNLKDLSPEYRQEVIEGKTQNIKERFDLKDGFVSHRDAYKMAKAQTMVPKKYAKYSAIASHIYDQMGLMPNHDNCKITPTYRGIDSWYLYFGEGPNKYCVKIAGYRAFKNNYFSQNDIPVKELIIVDYVHDTYAIMDQTALEEMKISRPDPEGQEWDPEEEGLTKGYLEDYMATHKTEGLENFLQIL